MSPVVIVALIAALFALLILIFTNGRALRAVAKLCVRGVLGGAGVFAVNALLGLAGVVTGVGVNVLTVFFTALLGIPGFVTLYAARFLLPR